MRKFPKLSVRHNRAKATRLGLAAAPVVLLLSSPAWAIRPVGQYQWDSSGSNPTSPVDGSGTWNTTTNANWIDFFQTENTWPTTGTVNNAIFGTDGTAGTVTINSPVAANALTFNALSSGDYIINSATPADILTLNGSSPTIFVNSGFPTINAPITGTAGLTLDGGGGLELNGINTYTGGTSLVNGTLAIGSDAAVNNGADGINFLGGVLLFDNYDSNLSFNDAGGFMYVGAAAGTPSSLSGNITGDTFPIFGGPGTLTLFGANTYAGTTYISQGKTIIATPGALPSDTPLVFYAGAVLGINDDSEITPTNTLFFTTGGDLEFENYDSNLSFDNIVNLGLGAAVGTPSSLAGSITGSDGLNYVGPGTLILTGANTYSGGTTISDGVLQIDNGGTTGTLPGDVMNNASLVFARGDDVQFDGNISGSGTVTQVGPGILTLTNTNSYTGGTIVSNSTLAITSDAAINNAAGGITFDGNGILQFNNYTSSLSFDTTNTTDTNGGDLGLGAALGTPSTLAGSINVPYFTYWGPGTLVLTNTNSSAIVNYIVAGTLVAGGPGTLPAPNATVLYGGTLAIGSDAELNNTTAGLFFVYPTSGAALQLDNYTSQLNFDSTANPGLINLGLGAAAGAPSALNGNITGPGGLIYVGPGTLTLDGVNTYSGGTSVNAGTLIIGAAQSLPKTGAMTIGTASSTAALILTNGAGAQTQSMVTINAGSTLDIGNNKLVINYGSAAADPVTAIAAAIASGYSAGHWTGDGIASSAAALNPSKFAIGYIDGDRAADTTAHTVAANQLILKYTLAGDAFLENSVGFDDLVVVAQNFGFTGKDWAGGNFNYDPTGSVGFADLVSVAQNFGFSSGVSEGSLGESLSPAWQVAQVPEPTALTLILAGAAGLLARRRRTRSTD